MLRLKLISFACVGVILLACGQSDAMHSQASETSDAVAAQGNDIASTSHKTTLKWNVIAEQSTLGFSAEQEGKAFSGEFKAFDADIYFDPDNLAESAVVIRVPIAEIDAKDNDRNATLPGKAWFSVKQFPEGVYKANKFSKTGEGQYIAEGTLSLKGIDKPLNLPFSLMIEQGQAIMTSQVVLDRTDWGIGEDPWHTDEWVSTSVTLNVKVVATK